jgi:16S rRNA (cytosine1402-N4)-methyltransferase
MRAHALGDPVWRGLPNAPAAAQPRLEVVGKAQRPGADEVARNPRARSAVLRLACRVRA